MKCPKCNSTNVVPFRGVMWCKDCKRPSDLSSVPPDDPGLLPQMIACPVCAHQVSSHADNCPSCGQPLGALFRLAQESTKEVEQAKIANAAQEVRKEDEINFETNVIVVLIIGIFALVLFIIIVLKGLGY